MKRIQLILGLLILTSALLASCVNYPEEPQEVLPYCKELYQDLLAEDPNFPPAFIGYCVATIQTGDIKAAQGLCGYEGVWDDIGVSSRKECIAFFKAYE